MSNSRGLVPVDSSGPREWALERYKTAVRPLTPEFKRSQKLSKIANKAVAPLFIAWIFSIFIGWSYLSISLFMAAMAIAITASVLHGWKREPVVPVNNRELIEAVGAGHRSYLMDRMIENPVITDHLNVGNALSLWEKVEIIGGPLQSEVHSMLMGMADRAATSTTPQPQLPSGLQSASQYAASLIESTLGVSRKSVFGSPAESNDNKQIRLMLEKIDALLMERRRVEAAASGIAIESVEDPVGWNFKRALESAEQETKLLRSVAEDLENPNQNKI